MLLSLVQSSSLFSSSSILHTHLSHPLKPSFLLPKTLFSIEPSTKTSLLKLAPRNAKAVHASLLESPVLWAGRLCVYYALLKTGLVGSPANPLVSGFTFLYSRFEFSFDSFFGFLIYIFFPFG